MSDLNPLLLKAQEDYNRVAEEIRKRRISWGNRQNEYSNWLKEYKRKLKEEENEKSY